MVASQPKRILITDDEPGIVDILAGMLGRFGFATLKAYSGAECLSLAKAEQPDLIFLDIMMERLDGWEVARLIKNDPALRDIPIIMVTAKPLTFEDVKDRSVLIENYILKPVSAATLKQAVDEVFTARTRIERTLEMARKSGVAAEIIDTYRDRYEKLHTQAQRNKKLLILMSQLYPESKAKTNPASHNMLASLRKGLESQEEELRRLEKILTTPA